MSSVNQLVKKRKSAFNGLIAACLVTACMDQTSIQTGYVGERNSCQNQAERNIGQYTTPDMDPRSQNAQLVTLFSDCMFERGWTVATPDREGDQHAGVGVGVAPPPDRSGVTAARREQEAINDAEVPESYYRQQETIEEKRQRALENIRREEQGLPPLAPAAQQRVPVQQPATSVGAGINQGGPQVSTAARKAQVPAQQPEPQPIIQKQVIEQPAPQPAPQPVPQPQYQQPPAPEPQRAPPPPVKNIQRWVPAYQPDPNAPVVAPVPAPVPVPLPPMPYQAPQPPAAPYYNIPGSPVAAPVPWVQADEQPDVRTMENGQKCLVRRIPEGKSIEDVPEREKCVPSTAEPVEPKVLEIP